MKIFFKKALPCFMVMVISMIIIGCKSTTQSNPEENIAVNNAYAPDRTNAPGDYNPPKNWDNNLNDMYAPKPFECPAYYNDYNMAGKTKYDIYLEEAISGSISNSLVGVTNTVSLTVLTNAINQKLMTQRNTFLFKWMRIISRNYGDYVNTITGGSATLDIESDMIMLGGNAVATLTPAAGTKTAWNAALLAFGGSKLSYDKNIFLNQSVLLLAAKMEQNRVQERDGIRAKMDDTINEYSLGEAGLDLQDLYESGSLIKVLESVASNQQSSNTNSILQLMGTNSAVLIKYFQTPQVPPGTNQPAGTNN